MAGEFDDVSVMFCDIVSFTLLSAKIKAEKVVRSVLFYLIFSYPLYSLSTSSQVLFSLIVNVITCDYMPQAAPHALGDGPKHYVHRIRYHLLPEQNLQGFLFIT